MIPQTASWPAGGTAPPPPTAAPRRGPTVAGAVIVVVGVVAAGLLWLAAGRRVDDAVSGLARAPVGCQTVLDFETTGDFLVFAETTGTFPDVRGDCGASGSYDLDVDRPTVRVQVTDPDGAPVDVRAADGTEYDRNGARGVAVGELTVGVPGDHLIRVESPDGPFAVAVGPDPEDAGNVLRTLAIVVGLASLVLGVVAIASGASRRRQPVVGQPLPSERPAGLAGWDGGAVPPATGPPAHGPIGRPTPTGGAGSTPARPAPPRPTRIPGEPLGPGWSRPPAAQSSPPTRGPRPETDAPVPDSAASSWDAAASMEPSWPADTDGPPTEPPTERRGTDARERVRGIDPLPAPRRPSTAGDPGDPWAPPRSDRPDR